MLKEIKIYAILIKLMIIPFIKLKILNKSCPKKEYLFKLMGVIKPFQLLGT